MMAATRQVRFQVLITEDVRDALRDVAFEERTSMQQIAARLLRDYVRRYPKWQHLGETEDDDA